MNKSELRALCDAPLPKDSPVRLAWEQYEQTPEYENTRRWALNEAHVDGSLWAAFYQGYSAAPKAAVDLEVKNKRLREMLAEFVTCAKPDSGLPINEARALLAESDKGGGNP